MGLQDWARHTQIPAGHLRYQISQHDLPLEAALTSLGWTPHAEVRAKHELIRITAADLRPGDHILGTENAGTDRQILTVRRVPDALQSRPAPRRAALAERVSTTSSATTPPRPPSGRTPPARR
ncbi:MULTISPECIES: hypothetical protein [Streptomyces]|uniref:hypothetical protein n=1 Tax=Streptomyces TaxID=1883 RepID=UPI00117D44DD|nr:hypothetical protein [Streptomyces sp. st115]